MLLRDPKSCHHVLGSRHTFPLRARSPLRACPAHPSGLHQWRCSSSPRSLRLNQSEAGKHARAGASTNGRLVGGASEPAGRVKRRGHGGAAGAAAGAGAAAAGGMWRARRRGAEAEGGETRPELPPRRVRAGSRREGWGQGRPGPGGVAWPHHWCPPWGEPAGREGPCFQVLRFCLGALEECCLPICGGKDGWSLVVVTKVQLLSAHLTCRLWKNPSI